MRAAIVGLSGPALSGDEAALFRALPPAGIILFARNVADPGQLCRLTDSLHDALPPGALVMVDQEGGRVARLRPPHWRAHPSAGRIGAIPDLDAASAAAWNTGALIGLDCAAAGIDVVCAPVLDLVHPGASDVVGDRSYGADPARVARLGRAMAEGLLSAGVQPVGKHAPGHGRASVDSHLALPVVDEAALDGDFSTFAANAWMPWMMTAHVVFPALDPAHPATLSRQVIAGTIRGRIGFEGVLVSDDLSMGALSGPPEARARAALSAGCDLALHCAGDLPTLRAVLEAVPELTGIAAARLTRAAGLAQERRLALNDTALERQRNDILPC